MLPAEFPADMKPDPKVFVRFLFILLMVRLQCLLKLFFRESLPIIPDCQQEFLLRFVIIRHDLDLFFCIADRIGEYISQDFYDNIIIRFYSDGARRISSLINDPDISLLI